MKKISKEQTISELLNSSVFGENISKEKMNIMIKHSTIFSFWNDICGKRFSLLSKPYAIKSSVIYISTKSSVVANELNLYKKKLIEKINSYSMPLGVEIKDIYFNYKNFNDNNNKEEDFIEDKPIHLTNKTVSDAKISETEEKMITECIEKINFLSDEQKNNFLKKIIQSNKAKSLREYKI